MMPDNLQSNKMVLKERFKGTVNIISSDKLSECNICLSYKLIMMGGGGVLNNLKTADISTQEPRGGNVMFVCL